MTYKRSVSKSVTEAQSVCCHGVRSNKCALVGAMFLSSSQIIIIIIITFSPHLNE